jgi:hypothetical protein
VCLWSGAPLTHAATLTLPGAGGPAGVPAVVRLAIDDAGGLLGTDIVIGYDPDVLTALELSTTPLSTSQTLSYNLEPDGVVRVSLYGPDPLDGSGDLLAITFLAFGPQGAFTPLTILSAEGNEGEIPVATVDGSFCIGGTGAEVGGLDATQLPGTSQVLFSWDGQAYAGSYNLYRGSGRDLSGFGCLLAGLSGTEVLDDGLVPPPGEAFLYLVTGNLCSGETSAGAGSDDIDRVLPVPCI